MAVDVYLKQDICNVLVAVNVGGPDESALALMVALSAQYRMPLEQLIELHGMGRRQALGAASAAFGLALPGGHEKRLRG